MNSQMNRKNAQGRSEKEPRASMHSLDPSSSKTLCAQISGRFPSPVLLEVHKHINMIG